MVYGPDKEAAVTLLTATDSTDAGHCKFHAFITKSPVAPATHDLHGLLDLDATSVTHSEAQHSWAFAPDGGYLGRKPGRIDVHDSRKRAEGPVADDV